MSTWYEDLPERWEAEQSALREAKIEFTIDEEAKAQNLLRLQLRITEESKIPDLPEKYSVLTLIVNFPVEYPFLRPIVTAPDILLPRHQNPTGKNLCLLPRNTSYWTPGTTLAQHLTEQLSKALIKGEITDPDTIAGDTDEQAEPVSEYFPSLSSIVFDPQFYQLKPLEQGKILELGRVKVGIPTGENFPCRMALIEAVDVKGNLLGKLPDQFNAIFPTTTIGYAYQLSKHPPNMDADKDLQWFHDEIKRAGIHLPAAKNEIKVKRGLTITNVIALTFPEEHIPGKEAWGWLFIVSFSGIVTENIRGKQVPKVIKSSYYIKANRMNTDELNFRNPSLRSLIDKKIAIIGLGALGAPSALEFAKNGIGELRLIDYDIVNAGTIVRWPLGITAIGLKKVDALQNTIQTNYPYTQVHTCNFRIGSVDDPNGSKCFDEILNGVSLIYDATAETGINQYLANEAERRGVPYISLYATPGVWGGVVMRVIPNETEGCWLCLQHSMDDGTMANPATNRDGNIQAAGCGDISFTGTSFELQNISSAGVRLAIATLCRHENSYPNSESDIGILSLVDDEGNPTFAKWSEYKLLKNESCLHCSKNAE